MRSLRFYRKNLFFMYVESLRSPRCQGQSILIKETPTPVHLQYTYTNERKECLMTQITKESGVSSYRQTYYTAYF